MMYHKFINDREVFSNGKTLHTEDGWISNPTQEMMEQNGWEVYVPPVIPPQPQTEPDMDQIVDAVKKMLSTGAEELSDEDALDVAAIYPTWASKVGKVVERGERLWWDGRLWKTLQLITELLPEWTPDTAVSLFTEVSVAEIPDWKQPVGSEDAYMKGDKAKHNDKTWESLVDNNVWEPGAVGTETLWREI